MKNLSPDRCSINIVGAAANADSGSWTCLVRANVLHPFNVSESISVSVATPYAVALNPEEPFVVLGAPAANQTHQEVVCAAEGLGGAVDPVLEWTVGGEKVEEHTLKAWQVIH